MDPRERVLLPLVSYPNVANEDDWETDVAALFLHLLLFDTVILRSPRLRDIAGLARILGGGETLELLNSGCLKVRLKAEGVGTLDHPNLEVVEPVYLYSTEPRRDLSEAFRDFVAPVGLGTAHYKRLKLAVVNQLVTADEPNFHREAMLSATREACARSPIFTKALELKLQSLGHKIPIDRETVSTTQLGPTLLRFEAPGLQLDPAVASKAVRGACAAIAELEAEFGRMRRDNTVTALAPDSVALMEAKLDFLYGAVDPDRRIAQFHRVLAASNLPDFQQAVLEREIDIETFLEVRSSNECKEFRAFLNQASDLNEKELNDRTQSLRARLGDAAQSTLGKAIRILATTAIGLAAVGPLGVAAGLAANSVDSFIVERLFPRSGIVTFIGSQYPTIFRFL